MKVRYCIDLKDSQIIDRLTLFSISERDKLYESLRDEPRTLAKLVAEELVRLRISVVFSISDCKWEWELLELKFT